MDLEVAIAEAHAAATDAFRRAGIDPTAVVVTATFRCEGCDMAVASRIPDDAPGLLADSLARSAEEAGEVGDVAY